MRTGRVESLVSSVLQLYTQEKRSIANVAELVGINKKTVKSILLENFVEIRGSVNNLLGRRFGKLKVKSLSTKKKNRKRLWLCECDCGKLCVVRGGDLVTGRQQSCGCFRNELAEDRLHNYRKGLCLVRGKTYNWKGVGEVSGQVFGRYRTSALARGLEFTITPEYVWNLWQEQKGLCAISGIVITLSGLGKSGSLDRIDSQKGYIPGNVQWVHKDINQMKFNLSQVDFINYCKLVANKN